MHKSTDDDMIGDDGLIGPSGRIGETEGEFSVAQFFRDGSSEYVRRWVGPQEAVETLKDYSERPAAKIGMIVKLIITDSGDFTNMQWEFGKGVVFPPRDPGKFVSSLP